MIKQKRIMFKEINQTSITLTSELKYKIKLLNINIILKNRELSMD